MQSVRDDNVTEDGAMAQQMAGVADASKVESWSSRFVDGEESVLGELLAAWAPQIVQSLARKYRGIFTEDQLEQIVLDALCAAWIKRQMFDPEKSSLKTWLDRIVQHLIADRAKSRWWKQRCRETSVANFKDDCLVDRHFQTLADGEDEGDTKVFQSLEMGALLKALAQLTPTERYVLLASMDETIKSQELAQELCISASTVRTYHQRAWEKILRALRAVGCLSPGEGQSCVGRSKPCRGQIPHKKQMRSESDWRSRG